MRHSQNFNFLGLKHFAPGQFWGAPSHGHIIEFYTFLLQLKNHASWSKTRCVFSIILILRGVIFFLKSKRPSILLTKNVNFNKNERESKMENPTQGFREKGFVLQHRN